jgi:hypothetical protein
MFEPTIMFVLSCYYSQNLRSRGSVMLNWSTGNRCCQPPMHPKKVMFVKNHCHIGSVMPVKQAECDTVTAGRATRSAGCLARMLRRWPIRVPYAEEAPSAHRKSSRDCPSFAIPGIRFRDRRGVLREPNGQTLSGSATYFFRLRAQSKAPATLKTRNDYFS